MSAPVQVVLRARTDADVDVLFRAFADLDTWEELSPTAPRAVVRASFERRLADGELDADVDFVIEADGVAVGRCTLMHEDALTRSAEVGISLVPDARGRGIGSAAIAQLVEFAFVRRNLRRLHLSAIASNAGALRSYAKAGFVEEGRRREACWVRGAYEDEIVMGLLRSDWLGARG